MNSRTLSLALITLAALTAGFGTYAQTAPAFSLTVMPSPAPEAGSLVTVVVAPSNFPLATADYTWFRDGTRLDTASGVGRSSLVIATDPAKTEIISIAVEVNPGAGFASARSSLMIRTLPSQEQLKKSLEDIQSSFTIELAPESPNPNEPFSVEIASPAFDRELATYRWFVNETFQRDESGKGRWFLPLTGAPEGISRAVRVEVTTPLGVTRSQSIAIRPVTTALYWWTNTSVPPWYKGKALPTSGAQVSLMALPNVRNPRDLRYHWEYHNGPDQKASGIGKIIYSFPIAYSLPETIEITMDDVMGGSFRKTTSITVEPARPGVTLYELRPRRGTVTTRRAATVTATPGDTLEFVSIPFFFPFGSDRYLSYEWQLNRDTHIGEPPDPWHFILRSNAGERGESKLSVQVRDTRKNGSAASASLTASFK